MERVRCKMKNCLLYEKDGRVGMCSEIVPTILKQVIPNSTECPFYSTDFEKDLKEMRRAGGINAIILKGHGHLTDQEKKKLKKKRKKSGSSK